MFACLQDAKDCAEVVGDPCRLGWVFACLLANFEQAGDLDHAIAAGQRALALAADLGDIALTIFAQHYLGHVYRGLGDYRQAIDCYRKNLARLQGAPSDERFGLLGSPL